MSASIPTVTMILRSHLLKKAWRGFQAHSHPQSGQVIEARPRPLGTRKIRSHSSFLHGISVCEFSIELVQFTSRRRPKRMAQPEIITAAIEAIGGGIASASTGGAACELPMNSRILFCEYALTAACILGSRCNTAAICSGLISSGNAILPNPGTSTIVSGIAIGCEDTTLICPHRREVELTPIPPPSRFHTARRSSRHRYRIRL